MAELAIDRTGDLFVVTATGTFSVEDGRSVFRALAPQMTPGASTPVLIDLRATRRDISYANMYRLLDEVRKDPNAPTVRVASLNRWENQFEGSQFFEASGRHVGLQVRAFTSEAAALDWLLPGVSEEVMAQATAAVQRAAAHAKIQMERLEEQARPEDADAPVDTDEPGHG